MANSCSPFLRAAAIRYCRVLRVYADRLLITRRTWPESGDLNPVPIRLVLDLWISKYAPPWVEAMTALKSELEGTRMAGPKDVYVLYIRTTPEKLWKAITSTEFTKKYFGEALAINPSAEAGKGAGR
jgi:hypothetical protein